MPQFEQVSVFGSLIFWSIISFGLLFFLLKKYAFPPILQALEAREEKIRAEIQESENLKKEAQNLKEKLEKEFRGAHQKAESIVQREIETSRNKLLHEIRAYTAQLTIASTEKFLQKALDDKDKKRLADESIEEVIREMEARARS